MQQSGPKRSWAEAVASSSGSVKRSFSASQSSSSSIGSADDEGFQMVGAPKRPKVQERKVGTQATQNTASFPKFDGVTHQRRTRPVYAPVEKVLGSYDRRTEVKSSNVAGRMHCVELKPEKMVAFPKLARYMASCAATTVKGESVWIVTVSGTEKPSGELVSQLEDEILTQSVWAGVEKPQALAIDCYEKRIEVIFNKPLIVLPGTELKRRKVVSLRSGTSALNFVTVEWADGKVKEDDNLLAQEVCMASGINPILGVCIGLKVLLILEGSPKELLKSDAEIHGLKLLDNAQPMWKVVKNGAPECYSCGGGRHLAKHCVSLWQRHSTRKWDSRSIISSKEMEMRIEERTAVRSHQLFTDEEAEESFQRIRMVDMAVPIPAKKMSPEAMRTIDEAIAKDAEVGQAIEMMNKPMKLCPTAQWIEERKKEMLMASVVLAKAGVEGHMTEGGIQTWAENAKWHSSSMRMLITEPEKLKVIDCGGDGNCGPLSALGALLASDAKDIPKSMEEMRKRVDHLVSLDPESKDPPSWWKSRHFETMANVLQRNVINIREKPDSWDRIAERVGCGNATHPIMVIGGENSKHWLAVVTEKGATQLAERAAKFGLKIVDEGCLTTWWKMKGVYTGDLPLTAPGHAISGPGSSPSNAMVVSDSQ